MAVATTAAAPPVMDADREPAPFSPAVVGVGVGHSEGGKEMMEGGSEVPEGDTEGGRSELGGAGGEARGAGKNGGGDVVGEVARGREIGVGTVGGDGFGDGVGEAFGA